MSKQLVLGSSSIYRQALLKRLHLPFEVCTPDIDEAPHLNETPLALTKRLAREKAYEVAKKYPSALIIGADQVGVLQGKILGKPHTHENAVKQLQMASRQCIQFYTGICLLDAKEQTYQLAVEQFDVYFRELTPTTIEQYLQKEQPYQCAGSFQAEGLGVALVDKYCGKDFSALIGLPLITLVTMLERAGLPPL